jgi:cytochrome c biogenesis protein CcmG/thiol:disulfide interchange protein DsbE
VNKNSLKMKKFARYIPFLIILTVTILLFIRVNQEGKNAGRNLIGSSPMIGKQVTDMELDTIFPAKGKLGEATYKGKYTVLNMFASWCVACLEEHPLLTGLKGSGMQVVGIAWRDNAEDTKRWLERNGNPFKIVGEDNMGKYGILMGVTGIPETFVVGPEGKILKHYKGPLLENNIQEINDLVGK